jgi:hypothetical protein
MILGRSSGLTARPAKTRLFLKRFLGCQSRAPFLHQTVVRMEGVRPAPAQTVLQGKTRIFPKLSVEEISRAIRQFAPDYCGDCVSHEPQALFENIRRFVSIAVVRVGPGLVHGALHQTRPGSVNAFAPFSKLQGPVFRSEPLLKIPPLRSADGTPIPAKWPAVSSSRAGFAFAGFMLERRSVNSREPVVRLRTSEQTDT